MRPIVYLREDEVSKLFQGADTKYGAVEGAARVFDNWTVLHASTDTADGNQSSVVAKAKFIPLADANALARSETQIASLPKPSREEYSVLYIFLAIDQSRLQHKCFLVRGNQKPLECEVRFIPDQSELYSRSKGLLETDALNSKSVGVVGLGSGGSSVAVELAKAGVGNFILMDFDRLELSNVSRHICGISDLGRYKTLAVKDSIRDKNPHARVTTLEIDIVDQRSKSASALSAVDLLICASDNDRSRFLLNDIALKNRVTAIFGRALTRASGGDVLRVRPFQGPCYSCLYSQNVRKEGGDDEEISQRSQAKQLLPEYTSESDFQSVVQVGLSSDIAPISNFMVKIALVELSKGLNSGITSLEDDLIADFYIWANRRDGAYESWPKLGFNFDKPAILRWYGARVARDPNCMVCGSGPL